MRDACRPRAWLSLLLRLLEIDDIDCPFPRACQGGVYSSICARSWVMREFRIRTVEGIEMFASRELHNLTAMFQLHGARRFSCGRHAQRIAVSRRARFHTGSLRRADFYAGGERATFCLPCIHARNPKQPGQAGMNVFVIESTRYTQELKARSEVINSPKLPLRHSDFTSSTRRQRICFGKESGLPR